MNNLSGFSVNSELARNEKTIVNRSIASLIRTNIPAPKPEKKKKTLLKVVSLTKGKTFKLSSLRT